MFFTWFKTTRRALDGNVAAVYSRQPENVPCRLFPLLILLLTLAYVWSRIHPTAAFVTLFTSPTSPTQSSSNHPATFRWNRLFTYCLFQLRMKWWMRNLESMIEPFFRIIIPFHDFFKATAQSRIFWCCILLFRKQNQPHEKPNIQQRLFFFFFANIKNNAVCIFSFELLPSSTRRIKKNIDFGQRICRKAASAVIIHFSWKLLTFLTAFTGTVFGTAKK